MSAVRIPLEPTADEARAFAKDAGWVQVARLATVRGYSPGDWRVAMRAFRLYVDALVANGKARKDEGITLRQVEEFFEAWFTMLALRRFIALEDKAREGK